MIKPIDDLLREWALWRLSPGSGFEGGGGSMIATLMANRGELIRSTAGPRCPLDRTADIELIYTNQLPKDMQTLMRVHYLDRDLPDDYKWRAVGVGERQYYRRLDMLHAVIAEILLQRKAA